MKVLVDAMGGDRAPKDIVLGALDAAQKEHVEVILVGQGEKILSVLSEEGISNLPQSVSIVHADDVVDMHDDPATVMKKRPDSSMIVGLKMLAAGEADAFVSAGSTGALLSAATLIVKRIKGIRRAAMGPVVPTATGNCIIMDCGANAECTPEFLHQFAHMGALYAKKILGVENPRVALLNIGTEDTKGTALQKDAYALLTQSAQTTGMNFIGNIEGRDVPLGGADVIVCDGFSGNVLLKSIEGTALFMAGMMKQMFKKNLLTKISALMCKDGIAAFKKKMDYREVGGTAFVGIQKPVIKAHGSSDRRAIECAVRQACTAADGNLAKEIETMLAKLSHNEVKTDVQ